MCIRVTHFCECVHMSRWNVCKTVCKSSVGRRGLCGLFFGASYLAEPRGEPLRSFLFVGRISESISVRVYTQAIVL